MYYNNYYGIALYWVKGEEQEQVLFHYCFCSILTSILRHLMVKMQNKAVLIIDLSFWPMYKSRVIFGLIFRLWKVNLYIGKYGICLRAFTVYRISNLWATVVWWWKSTMMVLEHDINTNSFDLHFMTFS